MVIHPYQKFFDKWIKDPKIKFIWISRCPGKINKRDKSERKESV